MTKKELLENSFFKAMPDDTEIVFNTAVRGENCIPVRMEDLSFRAEITGFAERGITKQLEGYCGYDPVFRNFLVINTNPY